MISRVCSAIGPSEPPIPFGKGEGRLPDSHFVHCALPPNPTPDPSPLGKGRGNTESLKSYDQSKANSY